MKPALHLVVLLFVAFAAIESAVCAPAANPAACRKHSLSIASFGAVGDGKTSNTEAFRGALKNLSLVAPDGGAQLVVPPGKWLTGSFNLTSHFTLYLHAGAVLLASQNESEWPAIPPLPSYGAGRDARGGRYCSFIFGTNLTDVVITGGNGTIDGQGKSWWRKFKAGELKLTRPYLIELMFSNQIQIFNITLVDAPTWFIHPVYCKDIIIQAVTMTAPIDSPNTDGIDPDSCQNMKIEDVFIVSGDDCIAVKSGWDQYGIKFGMPTKQLVIRRLVCISPDSAMIALGSEMSGGIEDVRAEDIYALNTQSAVRIKTGVGRGGFVRDIFIRRWHLQTMKYVFWITGDYGSHPDQGWDPKAFPEIDRINYMDVMAKNVNMTAQMAGIKGDVFKGICMSNISVTLSATPKKVQWNCSNVEGATSGVTGPPPCNLLPVKTPPVKCAFPEDLLPIESVALKICHPTSPI